jgi:hypothetical protein
MVQDDDDFEADTEVDADDEAESDVKVDFENEIAEEPLVPPAPHLSRLRKLSFSFVALLLVLVGLINLAMIIWFLWR